ncbi:DUF6197 family protein [Streptosporangium sp. CA-135522]|uniref:DUF6197 family protein n=1 Tax=Streptosporangium sp. CA-135522 TaxID=3240072 RepID=UPI003D8EBCCE
MSTSTVSRVLSAAADRIERDGWASHPQQRGVLLSDAIAVEVRDAPVDDSIRRELQDAAFEALRCHVASSSAGIGDWLRAPGRIQADVVASLRGAAAEAEMAGEAPEDDKSWFWGPGGERDDDDPVKRVVVEGEHYLIVDETCSGFRGFGGRRFDIEFFDGRTATTWNLWHQGTIPARWRDRYPDNARFV